DAEESVVVWAAATGLAELKPANGAAPLAEAYRLGQRDSMYGARTAALAAIAKCAAATGTPVLRTALGDKDWAVRVRAAQLLKQLDPSAAADLGAQVQAGAEPLAA